MTKLVPARESQTGNIANALSEKEYQMVAAAKADAKDVTDEEDVDNIG